MTEGGFSEEKANVLRFVQASSEMEAAALNPWPWLCPSLPAVQWTQRCDHFRAF